MGTAVAIYVLHGKKYGVSSFIAAYGHDRVSNQKVLPENGLYSSMRSVVYRAQKAFFLFNWYASTLVQGQCYYPGGDLASNHRPCNVHFVTSLCCPQGWTCFDNGLCAVTDTNDLAGVSAVGFASRGACTNPLWDQTACGDFCLSTC